MNKYIFALATASISIASYAAAPATTCPAGYITVIEHNMTIAPDTCPSGYVSAGSAESCLVATPNGACMMYAPTDMEFSDEPGFYIFSEICPLE